MPQMDLQEKLLLDYNDVFADIHNTLIFKSNIIKAEELLAGSTESIYKQESGDFTNQFRDISKYWRHQDSIIALFAIENQTDIDKQMVLRMFGFDGASYRSQYGEKQLYPVVPLVLNFSSKRWQKQYQSLYQLLSIPQALKPFVSNYKMNVIDVAFLDDDTRSRFTSDFKIIADYFYQKRTGRKLITGQELLKHPVAIAEFLRIFTKDNDYALVRDSIRSQASKGEIRMCNFLEEYKKIGREEGHRAGLQEGHRKGREEGHREGLLEGAENFAIKMVQNHKLSIQEAAELLQMSEADFQRLMDKQLTPSQA